MEYHLLEYILTSKYVSNYQRMEVVVSLNRQEYFNQYDR